MIRRRVCPSTHVAPWPRDRLGRRERRDPGGRTASSASVTRAAPTASAGPAVGDAEDAAHELPESLRPKVANERRHLRTERVVGEPSHRELATPLANRAGALPDRRAGRRSRPRPTDGPSRRPGSRCRRPRPLPRRHHRARRPRADPQPRPRRRRARTPHPAGLGSSRWRAGIAKTALVAYASASSSSGTIPANRTAPSRSSASAMRRRRGRSGPSPTTSQRRLDALAGPGATRTTVCRRPYSGSRASAVRPSERPVAARRSAAGAAAASVTRSAEGLEPNPVGARRPARCDAR